VLRLLIPSIAVIILLSPKLACAQSETSTTAPELPPIVDGVRIIPVQNLEGGGAPENADKLATLEQALDALTKNLTITTGDPSVKVVLGGAIIADFLFSSARPVAPGTPFFLTSGPLPGFRQSTFDASARQTTVFATISGPEIRGFQTGGQVLGVFYGSSLIQDVWGFLPLEAYAQLKNDKWRLAAGLQSDIFNPLNPTVLPISYLGATGNTGAERGQARIERFLHLSDNSQVTLTAGISDPVPTTVNNAFVVNEDNGWPNVEWRTALALGPLKGEGPEATRPFEIGFSGVIGQMRTTVPLTTQVIANVWGAGVDLHWAICPRFGFQGEAFTGQTLGTYMGSILQNVNSVTFQGIRSSGGWLELYAYILPEILHTHAGYGIDAPLPSDLAPGQPFRNQTWFANIIWDPTKHLQFACEFTYRMTDYTVLPNNQGFGIQGQTQLKF
jgi:hypothetical protein